MQRRLQIIHSHLQFGKDSSPSILLDSKTSEEASTPIIPIQKAKKPSEDDDDIEADMWAKRFFLFFFFDFSIFFCFIFFFVSILPLLRAEKLI